MTTPSPRRMTGAVLFAGAVTALTTAFTGTAQATTTPAPAPADNTAEQVAPLVQPSVVYETVTWSGYVYDRYNRQYLTDEPFTVTTQCTGFVVNPDGWVATAGHCVDPKGGKETIAQDAAEWALTNYYDYGSTLEVADVVGDYRIDTVDESGRILRDKIDREVGVSWGASVTGVKIQKSKPARVVGFQQFDQGDGALLKVEETDLNAIQLADTSGVEINSGVVAVGYPAIIQSFTDPDLTPTYDAGTVSSKKTIGGGLLSVFQLSAELSGGMSGGPTVDDNGDVIGVNSSHFVGEPFNYAVPAERIKELMGDAGVENTVSEITTTYREGIRAYFAGDRTTAVESLQEVLDEQPQNPLVRDYLAKAQDLPMPVEKDDKTNWALWVGVGVGVIAAIVVGLVLLVLLIKRVTRSKTTPVAAPAWVPAQGQPVVEPAPVAELQPEPVLVGAPAGPVGSQPVGFVPPAPQAPAPQAPAPQASVQRYCGHCGSRVGEGGQFCESCGTRHSL